MTEHLRNCFLQEQTSSVVSTQPPTRPLNIISSSTVIENATCPVSEMVQHVSLDNGCAMYTATIPADFAGNLPEGTVFQIMPDAAVVTVASSEVFQEGAALPNASVTFNESCGDALQQSIAPIPSTYAVEVSSPHRPSAQSSTEQVTLHSQGNISDLDLSFLTDPEDEPNNVLDLSAPAQISENMLMNQIAAPAMDSHESTSDSGSIVVVDVSKPIQLSQNALIVVDGKKCVVQQDPHTGLVVAYPVKEPDKPKKKRGRPRKIVTVETIESSHCEDETPTLVNEDDDLDPRNGLLEVVTDDGALVRRSSRKRKRTRVLKDYETGNLTQELGSDLDEKQPSEKVVPSCAKKKVKQKNIERLSKPLLSKDVTCKGEQLNGQICQLKNSNVQQEPVQTFLIQTADGQHLIMHVPVSSIPFGMSVHDVAQAIANKINSGVSQDESTSKSEGLLPLEITDSTSLVDVTMFDNSDDGSLNKIDSSSKELDRNPSSQLHVNSTIQSEANESSCSIESQSLCTTLSSFPSDSCTVDEKSHDVVEIMSTSSQTRLNEFSHTFVCSTSNSSESIKSTEVPKVAATIEQDSDFLFCQSEQEVKEYDMQSHSSDENLSQVYLNSTDVADQHALHKRMKTVFDENDPVTSVGMNEEIVITSSFGDESQEKVFFDCNSQGNNDQNDFCTVGLCPSKKNANVLFLHSPNHTGVVPRENASANVKENINENASECINENTNECINENTCEDIGKNSSEGISKTTSECIDKNACEYVSENASECISKSTSECICESTSKCICENTKECISKNTSEGISKNTSEYVSENTSEKNTDENTVPFTNLYNDWDISCTKQSDKIPVQIKNSDVKGDLYFQKLNPETGNSSVHTVSQAASEYCTSEDNPVSSVFVKTGSKSNSSSEIEKSNRNMLDDEKIVFSVSFTTNAETDTMDKTALSGNISNSELDQNKRNVVISQKKHRGRPRKYFHLPKTSFLTSQLPIIEMKKTAVTDSNIVATDNFALVTSPSKVPATVIPLPEKVLPLLLPKPNNFAEVKIQKCPKCEFIASNNDEYQLHISLHPEMTKHCKNCMFLCFQEDELVGHYKEHHPRCICSNCNFMAEHPYVIKRHMMRHGDDKKVSCTICGNMYKDRYILKMHVKLVHMPAETLFACYVCDKEFNRKAHLKRHLRTHGPEKPFKCPHCEYRGCEKSDISKHILIHEEPKHKCEVCGKTFRHLKNKELHLKRHKNQRDYKCGACNFFGYTFTDIRKHIERRHKNSGTITCNKCGQVYKSEEQMEEHQNSHECAMFVVVQTQSSSDSANEHLKEQAEVVNLKSTYEYEQPESSISAFTIAEKAVVIEALAGLSNNQVDVNSVKGIVSLSPHSGQMIVTGFEKTCQINSPNLSLISSESKEMAAELIQLGEENVLEFRVVAENENSLPAVEISVNSANNSVEENSKENFLLTTVVLEDSHTDNVQPNIAS